MCNKEEYRPVGFPMMLIWKRLHFIYHLQILSFPDFSSDLCKSTDDDDVSALDHHLDLENII